MPQRTINQISKGNSNENFKALTKRHFLWEAGAARGPTGRKLPQRTIKDRRGPAQAMARTASSWMSPMMRRLMAMKRSEVSTSTERGRAMSMSIFSLMRPGRAVMT